MLKLLHYQLYRTAVRHVARKLQIKYRHVGSQRIYDNLDCLPQRKVFLVSSPTDVDKVEAIGGDACGVDGAKLILSDSCSTTSEHVHTVLLSDGLRQHRDGLGSHVDVRWGLHLPLPPRHLAVGQIVHKWEICHGQNLSDFLPIFSKNLQEVFLHSCLPGNFVQKPCRAILPVDILFVIFHPSASFLATTLGLAQVKALGKDQFPAFRRTGIEISGVGMEPVVLIDRPPMLMPTYLLALLCGVVDLGRRIATPAVDMDYYLVRSLLPDWSACFHKCFYYSYKGNYNI